MPKKAVKHRFAPRRSAGLTNAWFAVYVGVMCKREKSWKQCSELPPYYGVLQQRGFYGEKFLKLKLTPNLDSNF